MVQPMVPCSVCGRHVRRSDAQCPFCARGGRVVPLALAGALALAVFAAPQESSAVGAQRDELLKQNVPVPTAYGIPPQNPAPRPPQQQTQPRRDSNDPLAAPEVPPGARGPRPPARNQRRRRLAPPPRHPRPVPAYGIAPHPDPGSPNL